MPQQVKPGDRAESKQPESESNKNQAESKNPDRRAEMPRGKKGSNATEDHWLTPEGL